MKKIIKNTLLSVCAIGLLAGCTSKDVEYESSTAATSASTQVDGKISNIAGSSEQVIGDDSSVISKTLKAVTHDGVNSIESEIEGNTVLLESVHFAFDKYNLSDDMREIATVNYSKINATEKIYSGVKIKLEGNCDEWGTDEYNYALGLKRAKTAKDALVADGVDADKIVMVSFGESNPICTQKNATCWKMNRRVDYRLLP